MEQLYLVDRMEMDLIPEPSQGQVRQVADWVKGLVERPARSVSKVQLRKEMPVSQAIQSITEFLLGLFPSKVKMILVIVHDVLLAVLDSQNKKGKIPLIKKVSVGLKALGAILKIVSVVVSNKK